MVSSGKRRSREFLDESWEDGGVVMLGGYVWPPTTYSCSFCKREFKSAQALGGHMNVHRRDRANQLNNNHGQNKKLCYDFQNPNPGLKRSSYLSLSMSLEVHRENNPLAALLAVEGGNDEPNCYKRRRTATKEVEVEVDNDERHVLFKVNSLKSCSIIQELDLELRL